MNPVHSFFIKQFWILMIVATLFNAFIFYRKGKKNIKSNPELKDGYRVLIRGYIIYLNIPWIIMGLGVTIGGVPNIMYYFRPKDGNWFVILWYVSIVSLWVLGSYWIFFKNGAQTLSRYPGAINFQVLWKNHSITNPVLIKLFWITLMAAGMAAMTFFLTSDIKIPDYAN